VKETKAAGGYIQDNEAKEVEIHDGKRTTLKATNAPASSVLIRKIDSVTNRAISGYAGSCRRASTSCVRSNRQRAAFPTTA